MVPKEGNCMVHLSCALRQAFGEVELCLVEGVPGVKSNDLGKIKCSVFALGTVREVLRDVVSGFGRHSCSRLE